MPITQTIYETRWALTIPFYDGRSFLGKYGWSDADKNEPVIRTFRTRKLAREARKNLGWWEDQEVRVVKIQLITSKVAH